MAKYNPYTAPRAYEWRPVFACDNCPKMESCKYKSCKYYHMRKNPYSIYPIIQEDNGIPGNKIIIRNNSPTFYIQKIIDLFDNRDLESIVLKGEDYYISTTIKVAKILVDKYSFNEDKTLKYSRKKKIIRKRTKRHKFRKYNVRYRVAAHVVEIKLSSKKSPIIKESNEIK